MNTYRMIVPAALGLLLGACATGPTLTEQHFGDSVRHMIQAQTYDASTLATPSTELPESADGERLENVLQTYRTDVYKPQAGGNNVVLSVGESR